MSDGYIDLAIAIIKQAEMDYKKALKNCDDKSPTVRENAEITIRECERFFLGKWGQLLTLCNGEYIIERCRKEVAQKKKKE